MFYIRHKIFFKTCFFLYDCTHALIIFTIKINDLYFLIMFFVMPLKDSILVKPLKDCISISTFMRNLFFV